MIPVSDARQDGTFEIREDGVEAFALLRRLEWERAANVAGPCLGENGETIRSREVVGDPVGDTVGLPPEGLRIHVAGMGHSALFYFDWHRRRKTHCDDRARG